MTREDRQHRVDEDGHLSEEDIVQSVSRQPVTDGVRRHAAECELCAERLAAAVSVLGIEPIDRAAAAGRVAAILDRLTAVGAISAGPARGATIRVALTEGGLTVLDTDTEVRITRAVATRSTASIADLPGVAFFRRLGPIKVEIHLARTEGERFHLIVGLASDDGVVDDARLVLHRGPRRLETQPAPSGAASFKNLRIGQYRLEVSRETHTVGFVSIEVEADHGEAAR